MGAVAVLALAAVAGCSSGSPPSSASPVGRLTVTGVKLGTGLFGTDRGQQALPAWRFSFRGVTGTADVLAVAAPGGTGQPASSRSQPWTTPCSRGGTGGR
ncbi:MAG TPA: hypothetical protein VHW06_12015 [Streptosporangiaceae bacterium]|nr:hypothetical protein [Streptosporangiaceae bacterium]